MKPNILHAIFFDNYQNWNNFYQRAKRRIRPVVKREINKFRDCGDLRKGYRLFVCEGCHAVKMVAFRCKGKFCPTCATGESQRWAEMMANDLFTVTHRHVVFTIDEGLREIFLMKNYRKELLKGLMDEAARILLDFFRKHHLQAGIVATLHTFGSQRSLALGSHRKTTGDRRFLLPLDVPEKKVASSGVSPSIPTHSFEAVSSISLNVLIDCRLF